jgi:hypothetical protein
MVEVEGSKVRGRSAKVTCRPNGVVTELHDRMPAILAESDWPQWLGAEMEQAVTATWGELLAGASAATIIIAGVIWAVIGVFFNDLKRNYRIMQTQLDGVHFAINGLTVSVAELKASMPALVSGMNDGLDGIEKLRGDVDLMNGNVARIATFLGHLAATPPSFPSDLK